MLTMSNSLQIVCGSLDSLCDVCSAPVSAPVPTWTGVPTRSTRPAATDPVPVSHYLYSHNNFIHTLNVLQGSCNCTVVTQKNTCPLFIYFTHVAFLNLSHF